MTTFIIRNKRKKYVARLAAAVLWIGLWQFAAVKTGQELILPAPFAVIRRIFELAAAPAFWGAVGYSFLSVFCGFALGVIAGTVLAVLACVSGILRELMSPLLLLTKATPVASFIVLALLWIKSPYLATFISCIAVLPIVWANMVQGIDNTDRELLEMARCFRFSPFKKFRYLYFPSVYPYFVSACSTALGFAWKSGIAAEILGLPKHTVGTNVYYAKIYLETPDVFAWTAVIIALSVLIEKVLVGLLRRSAGKRNVVRQKKEETV